MKAKLLLVPTFLIMNLFVQKMSFEYVWIENKKNILMFDNLICYGVQDDPLRYQWAHQERSLAKKFKNHSYKCKNITNVMFNKAVNLKKMYN